MSPVIITGGAMVAEAVHIQPIQPIVPTISLSQVDYEQVLGKQGLKYMTNATKMSLVASIAAMENAGVNSVDPVRSGIVLATNLASLNTVTQFDLVSLEEGVTCVSPMKVPNVILNAPAARLGIHHKISGFNTTLSSGRVAAIDALEYAYNAIQTGEVDVCLVVAVEEYSSEYKNWFAETGFLTGNVLNNLCQAAGALLLESEEHANKRNAKAIGKIWGFQSVFEPSLLIENEKTEALKNAYKELAVSCKGVNQICIASNESEIATDDRELLKKCFECSKVLNSNNYITGELYSVSGIAQVIYSLSVGEEGPMALVNYDWFGNFRSALLERSDI